MPSLKDVLLRPESRRPDPEPVRVDLGRVVLVGTIVWALVLLGAGVARLAGVTGATEVLWVAVVGVLLGLLGILWSRRNRARWENETD